MLVKFDSQLFCESNNEQDILFLVSILTNSHRNNIAIIIDEVDQTSVYKNFPENIKEIIKASFISYINNSTTEDYCISQQSCNERSFNLKESRIFFNQQYLIILENSLNDGYFIDALIRCYKKFSKKILRSKNNDWLKYENAGGVGNIRNVIEATKLRFKDLPKMNHKYLRCYVLIDSDKKYPTQQDSTEREQLFTYLETNDIKYHQLYKREIENYLPFESIAELFENQQVLSVLQKFSPEMLDFFDLEVGFGNVNRKSLSSKVKELYDSLSNSDYDVLRGKSYKLKSFKKKAPEKFNSVNIAMLDKRVKHQSDPTELKKIINSIECEL